MASIYLDYNASTPVDPIGIEGARSSNEEHQR